LNKRQIKKRDKLLLIAIRELNNDVAKDLGEPPISEQSLMDTFHRIRNHPDQVSQTLKHYRKYILNR